MPRSGNGPVPVCSPARVSLPAHTVGGAADSRGRLPVQYRTGRARRAVVIAVLGTAVLGAAPPAFAGPPATGPSVAESPAQHTAVQRSLGLKGARNAPVRHRWIPDGRRRRRPLRSGVPHGCAGQADPARPRATRSLERHDRRRPPHDARADARTGSASAGAAGNWYDVLGQSPITTLVDMPAAYRAFVTGPGANEAFSAVLHDIAASDGSVIYTAALARTAPGGRRPYCSPSSGSRARR